MANEEVKNIKYPIDINSETWEKFKNKIPRSKTINEFLVEMIEEEIKKK